MNKGSAVYLLPLWENLSSRIFTSSGSGNELRTLNMWGKSSLSELHPWPVLEAGNLRLLSVSLIPRCSLPCCHWWNLWRMWSCREQKTGQSNGASSLVKIWLLLERNLWPVGRLGVFSSILGWSLNKYEMGDKSPRHYYAIILSFSSESDVISDLPDTLTLSGGDAFLKAALVLYLFHGPVLTLELIIGS